MNKIYYQKWRVFFRIDLFERGGRGKVDSTRAVLRDNYLPIIISAAFSSY